MIIERMNKLEDKMTFTAAEAEELGVFEETALTEEELGTDGELEPDVK